MCLPTAPCLQAYVRYKEKRKNLVFGKKIRYQTRKVGGALGCGAAGLCILGGLVLEAYCSAVGRAELHAWPSACVRLPGPSPFLLLGPCIPPAPTKLTVVPSAPNLLQALADQRPRVGGKFVRMPREG